MYRINALAAGATPIEVPEKNRTVDVDAILAGCTDATKLVFMANPANPTGTMIETGEMARLASGLPSQTILVLDGAYAEFEDGYDGGAKLVTSRENVVMTRTFSKLYGLGALRIGWAYGPQNVIAALNRVRGPFNLSNSQLITAEAAVRDTAHAQSSREVNRKAREQLAKSLTDIGVPSDASHANFLLARFADTSEAEACNAHLLSQGIIVRRVGGYKLPHCLRITIGDDASCNRVILAITVFKEAG